MSSFLDMVWPEMPNTGQPPGLIDIAPSVCVDPRTSRPARRAFVGTNSDSPPVRVCLFAPLETGVETEDSSSGAVSDPYEPFAEPAAEASPAAAEIESPSDLDDEQYANIVSDLFGDEVLDLHTSAKSQPAVAPAAVLGSSSPFLLLKAKAKDGGPAAVSASSSSSSVGPAVVSASTSPSHPPAAVSASTFPRNPLTMVPPMHRMPPPPPPPPAASSGSATGKGKGVPTHINTGFLNVVAQLYELRIPPT
jgi:hypothetical protein